MEFNDGITESFSRSTTHKRCELVYQDRFSWWSDAKPSSAVVSALSEVADVEHDELPPLYDAVDTEALDALFRPPKGENPLMSLNLVVGEYGVTITGSGDLLVFTLDPVSKNGSEASASQE